MEAVFDSFSIEGELNGPTNMARDLELLDAALQGASGCRVYFWDGVWVSLGRNQAPSESLVEGFERWVGRPTGGGAVLHGHDITVGIAMPYEGRSVKAAYQMVVTPLVAAMRQCGLPARLSTELPTLSQNDCFAGSSPYDAIHERSGAKLCGCALRMVRGAALLQASIPYMEPLIEPALAIRGAVRHPVTEWHYAKLVKALAGG